MRMYFDLGILLSLFFLKTPFDTECWIKSNSSSFVSTLPPEVTDFEFENGRRYHGYMKGCKLRHFFLAFISITRMANIYNVSPF